jgi:glutamyl-tRNA(Gln) amidotransferase subunit D
MRLGSLNLTKVKEIMLTSIAGEITEREPHNGNLILQGGIPEVERFVSSYWK